MPPAPPAPPPLPPPATPHPEEAQQVAQEEAAVVKKLESGRRVRSRTPLRRIAQKAKEIRAAKVAAKPAPVVPAPKPSVSAGQQVLLETQQKIHEARDRVADLRLQYRALLEAFAPNNPPAESAKDFVDQLNLLNQQIAELQEVEDHLRTRNLKDSISAKTASGTEPPVSAKPSKASKADLGKRAVSLAPVPKIKKAKPASVPPVKAPPLTGSAGRSVSLAQQAPKSSAPVKPVPAPPVKAPPALGSSSASAAPKPSAPVEVIEVPEGGRSSSPLPVRRATRAVETPVAASSVVVDPEEERPVIGLDYHNTIEFEHRVHPSIVEDLKTLQRQGFDLAIVSFASNIETQERVVNTCRELNTQLLRPFTTIAVTRTKLLKDVENGRSITGHLGAKAKVIRSLGVVAFVDDQAAILRDIQSLQVQRARKNKIQTYQAVQHKERAIKELVNYFKDQNAAEWGKPSFLRHL